MKWSFFKFDKSRIVIFVILFSLFPAEVQYPSTGCKIFEPPGILQAICTVGPYPMLFSLFVTVFDKYARTGFLIIFTMIIDFIISYTLSFPLNLVYKKLKSKKW